MRRPLPHVGPGSGLGHELPWSPAEASGPIRVDFLVGEGRVTRGKSSSLEAPNGLNGGPFPSPSAVAPSRRKPTFRWLLI
jgi:hypothetical protein